MGVFVHQSASYHTLHELAPRHIANMGSAALTLLLWVARHRAVPLLDGEGLDTRLAVQDVWIPRYAGQLRRSCRPRFLGAFRQKTLPPPFLGLLRASRGGFKLAPIESFSALRDSAICVDSPLIPASEASADLGGQAMQEVEQHSKMDRQ